MQDILLKKSLLQKKSRSGFPEPPLLVSVHSGTTLLNRHWMILLVGTTGFEPAAPWTPFRNICFSCLFISYHIYSIFNWHFIYLDYNAFHGFAISFTVFYINLVPRIVPRKNEFSGQWPPELFSEGCYTEKKRRFLCHWQICKLKN